MTEEERRRLYGPEKGHYNADEDVYVDPQEAVGVAAPATETIPTNASPADQPTTVEDDVQRAKANLDRVNAESNREYAAILADRNKTFDQMVLDYNDRINEERKQQRLQEQANMASSMATGTTELAANLINMFSVGQLHASNQQYKNFSQDWMKKADQDMREHRKRRGDMYDALQRLKLQQDQVRTAGRIEDMRIRQQQAQNAYNIALQQRQYEDARRDREWQQQYQERQADRQDRQAERQARQTDASIAQGWARIQHEKDRFNIGLKMQGYNPDGTPNEEYQKQLAEVKAIASGGGGSRTSIVSYNILDKDGKPNVAQMQPKEMEDLLTKARVAIANDLGEGEQIEFTTELEEATRMGDDNKINEVLNKWMGKSVTCEQMIRNIDLTYKGKHGLTQQQPTSGNNNNQQQQKNNTNPRTGLGGYN